MLTDEEITRELATKVMGWKPTDPDSRWFEAESGRASFCKPILNGQLLTVQEAAHQWAPLELIADAWEVRDRLKTLGLVCIETQDERELCRFWPKQLPKFGNGYVHGIADSAPRAICLAALRAVGIEPEGEA
jgi:hypothetical protein